LRFGKSVDPISAAGTAFFNPAGWFSLYGDASDKAADGIPPGREATFSSEGIIPTDREAPFGPEGTSSASREASFGPEGTIPAGRSETFGHTTMSLASQNKQFTEITSFSIPNS
jgi:hypothetical protein